MTRTKRSFWNVGSGLLFTAATACVSLIATPWLLSWLGAERFGAYRVLVDWFGYLALFELGLGGAMMAHLAVAVGRADAERVRKVVAAGWHAYLRITLAMLVGGAALILVLPHLMTLHTISPRELRTAGAIALCSSLLTPLLIFRTLAEARQRGYLVSLLLSVHALFLTALLLITARAGWGLVGQSIAALIAQVPLVLLLMSDGLKAYPGIFSTKADREVKKAIWSLNRPTLVHNVSGRVGLISDNLVIAWAIGPMAVAPFYLTQRLATLAQGQLQGIGGATWAGLVELHEQKQHSTFRARFLELTGMVSGLGIAVLGPIAAYNHHFITRWLGQGFYAGELVTAVACVNIWFWSLYSTWHWPLSGTGNIRLWMPYAIAFTIINVTVSITATLLFGIVGPLLGTLASFIAVNSWALPRLLNRVFDIPPGILWKTAVVPLAWGIPFVVSLWMFSHSHVIPAGWVGLLAELSAATLCGVGLWGAFNLSGEDRALWLSRVRSAFAR